MASDKKIPGPGDSDFDKTFPWVAGQAKKGKVVHFRIPPEMGFQGFMKLLNCLETDEEREEFLSLFIVKSTDVKDSQ